MENTDPCLWLQKRAEMYAAIAESDFKQVKKVVFHFDDPEAGWVDRPSALTVKWLQNCICRACGAIP
jgi:hypothetical protein